MSDPVRLALVGCGRIAQVAHLPCGTICCAGTTRPTHVRFQCASERKAADHPYLDGRKQSTGRALTQRASAVLILVMIWMSVVVGTRTGSIGQLSAAWLTVVAAAAGPGAYLLQGVRQREPDLGGKRRVVGAEVGEEDVPA